MNTQFYRRTELSNFPIFLHPESIPHTLDIAYEVMKEELALWKESPAAWKLGGTSRTTSRLYSVSVPYFGMLHTAEVWNTPCAPQLKNKQRTSAELECMLRLGESFSSVLHAGEAALMSCPSELLFDQWAWGVEMPFSPVANLPELGLPALVADRCAAGGLALGTLHEFFPESIKEWQHASVQLAIDGKIQAEGRLDALTASPDVCVRRFIVEALRRGFTPKAGQWIASGGLTPCFSLSAAKQIDIFYAGQSECTVFLAK